MSHDTKIEHTPTPWILGKISDVGYSGAQAPCQIWTGKGAGWGLVATTNHWCQAKPINSVDAAFIVKACNAHDELVAALDYALTQVEYDQFKDGNTVTGQEALKRGRAALAKVQP